MGEASTTKVGLQLHSDRRKDSGSLQRHALPHTPAIRLLSLRALCMAGIAGQATSLLHISRSPHPHPKTRYPHYPHFTAAETEGQRFHRWLCRRRDLNSDGTDSVRNFYQLSCLLFGLPRLSFRTCVAAVATSELRPVSAVLTSKGRGADVCRPPTVRQALSVIASGLPNRHPSRRDRRENRGSERKGVA